MKYPEQKIETPLLFVQHSKVSVGNNNIRVLNEEGDVSVSPNQIGALQLGPGTSITHEAVKLLTSYHTQIQWVADDFLHTYAYSFDSRQRSKNLIKQAYLVSHENERLIVAKKMFSLRFGDENISSQTIASLRGKEGDRVFKEYQRISKENGIEWKSRHYVPSKPEESDLPNKILSLANSYLYGICLSVIMQLGYSPSLGFIHCGYGLSFVYDVSDFYKTKFIVPLAFSIAAQKPMMDFRKDVKIKIIELFEKERLTTQIENDIESVLSVSFNDPKEENDLWMP